MNQIVPVEDKAKRQLIEVIDPVPVLDTSRFEHMQRIATVMARSSLIPESLCTFGTKDNKQDLPYEQVLSNCFLVVNQAVRWGLDPFAVAQCVSVVHGKLCYEGKLVSAVLGAVPGIRQTLTLDLTGSPRAYALTVAEVVSEGDLVRIVALVDIQAEVQAAEAAALRELMQVLSHEIMNSLTPVTSMAQSTEALLSEVLSEEPALTEARAAVASMARRSEGLMRFVEAYRELARMPTPRPAEVDVTEFVQDLARLFRSRWGDAVILETQASEISAVFDRDLLLHAMLNILTNAAEAAASSPHPRVRLRVEATAEGRLSLTVSDNGGGVDLPDPSVIFRPFFTTKPTGSGVGLSIARHVALGHGGEVSAANAPPGASITMVI